MIELFSYPFMVRALEAAILVGAVCGFVGAFVVMKRLAFMSEGIGHASVLGVALGILFGVSPLPAMAIFGVVFALILAVVTSRGSIATDTAIGVLFSTSLALGVLVLSHRQIYQGDLTKLFFGDLLTISSTEIELIAALSILVIGSLVLFFRPFSILIFDEQYAKRAGIQTDLMTVFLYIIIALTIVASIKLVGALLVTSLLVVPASIILPRVGSLAKLACFSTLLGVAIASSGIILSYLLNTPPGATIVVCAGLLFGAHTLKDAYT